MIYRVADIMFDVRLDGRDELPLLPSFRPFVTVPPPTGDGRPCSCMPGVDELAIPVEEVPGFAGRKLLERQTSDLGYSELYELQDGYLVGICITETSPLHWLLIKRHCPVGLASAGLQESTLSGNMRSSVIIDWKDRYAGDSLCSLLRFWFSVICVDFNAVSIHASAVSVPVSALYPEESSDLSRCAVLFLGRSGTGKSTHSSLWLKNIQRAQLMNDDNPVIRFEGTPMAYGSPWSGSTACWKNVSAPLTALVRLSQATYNRFRVLDDIDGMVSVLPSCSVLRYDTALYDKMCDILSVVTDAVVTARLDCLPDDDAAACCRDGIKTAYENTKKNE